MVDRMALRLSLASSFERWGLNVFSYSSPLVSRSFFWVSRRS